MSNGSGPVKSIFTISLDFELHWGVSDRHTVETYGLNLRNTRRAIDGMLELYKKYNVHVTWATVGMLFCRKKEELFSYVTEEMRPHYTVKSFSNYTVAEGAGADETADPFHFAPAVLAKIRQVPGQEIGTHTFSHYYTLEDGQNPEQFRADLQAAIRIAGEYGIKLHSIVFPRMQYDERYIQILKEVGISYYRGSQPVLEYAPVSRLLETRKRRMTRFLDSYINYKGRHLYPVKDLMNQQLPVNVPQSLFLRPFSNKLSFLEFMKLRRIKKQMTKAAKTGSLYHLWWHPHNFGNNVEKNLQFLENILKHYQHLSGKYGMVSLNMEEAGKLFESKPVYAAHSVAGVPV